MLKGCCCFSLRTGTIITGSFDLVTAAIIMLVSTFQAATTTDIQEERTDEEELVANAIYVGTILGVVASSLRVIMSAILLYGALTSTKWAFLPWLFFEALTLGLTCIIGIVFVFLVTWEALFLVIGTALYWYLWAVVLSYYWELRNSD